MQVSKWKGRFLIQIKAYMSTYVAWAFLFLVNADTMGIYSILRAIIWILHFSIQCLIYFILLLQKKNFEIKIIKLDLWLQVAESLNPWLILIVFNYLFINELKRRVLIINKLRSICFNQFFIIIIFIFFNVCYLSEILSLLYNNYSFKLKNTYMD